MANAYFSQKSFSMLIYILFFQVSLNANHKADIEKALAEAHEDLFKSAQDYIFNLMYRDCLPRFLRSKTYKRLCK